MRGKGREEKLVGIKSDSINQHLNRVMRGLGIKKKYPETNIHSIRKLKAQELWDEMRGKGCSKKEAMYKVSKYLGHGKNRYDIINTYVKNQW